MKMGLISISLNNFVTSAPIFKMSETIRRGDTAPQLQCRKYSKLLTPKAALGGILVGIGGGRGV